MSVKKIPYPVKRSTLSKIYKISPKTFQTWLKDIDINHSKTLTPADLKKIEETYGLPYDT
jgi:hypothetical protein